MKRIVSLDFARGLAMMCMLGFHVLIHVSWHAQTSNYSNIDEMVESGLMGLFVVIFIVANFRALFLLVSMTIYGYILTKAMRNGNAKGILVKNLFFAFMLYLVALFTEAFAANWGILGRTIQLGQWSPQYIRRIMHFETLNSIAVSIAILSITFFIFSKLKILSEKKTVILSLVILAAIVMIVHIIIQPLVYVWFPDYYEGGAIGGAQYNWDSPGEFFLKLFLSALFGVEQPIFPFMATTFIGGIIGFQLGQEEVKRDLPKKGMICGLLVVLLGILLLLSDLSQFSVDLDVFPPWFYLFTTGLQIIILMGILRMVEFSERVTKSDKMAKFVKKTTFVRRWGIVSLSLFVLQVYPEFLLRYLGNIVTGGSVEFFERGQAGGLPSIIMIFVVIIVWDLLIRLWEKVKFKYSFEWIMSTIGGKVLRRSGMVLKDPTERLNIEKVLYTPEPILFLE